MSDLPLRCKCRRQAVTSLRCSRCFVPICPDCSRPAAVGILCRECGKGQRSHVYEAGSKEYLKGGVAAFGSAVLGGWILDSMHGFGFFYFWICFLYGLAVAELTLRATGRKRGTPMEILVGLAAGSGIIAGWLVSAMLSDGDIMQALLMGLRDPMSYVSIGLAVFAAVSRVRHL